MRGFFLYSNRPHGIADAADAHQADALHISDLFPADLREDHRRKAQLLRLLNPLVGLADRPDLTA